MPGKLLAEASGEEFKRPIVTFQTFLQQAAEQHSDRLALVCCHQPAEFLHQVSHDSDKAPPYLRWTYSQLNNAAITFAAKLHSLGVRRGMRIAAFLRNNAQYAVGFWAAALLGCPFVPINATFAGLADDAQHMLSVAEASVVMVEDGKMAHDLEDGAPSQMKAMLAKFICNETADDGADSSLDWKFLESIYRTDQVLPMPSAEDCRVSLEDLALVIFTSGTTSKPKGVMVTNQNLVANALSAAQALAADTSSRSCDHLPLFHIFGISFMLSFWGAGGTVCLPSASFNPAATLSAIQAEKLTHLPGPPSLLNAVISHPSLKSTDTKSLIEIVMAAAVVMPEAIRAVSDALGCSKVACPFGMSEGTPITFTPYESLPIEYSEDGITTGPCCTGARARICAPNSRKVLERGEIGELHIGGPMVTPGYLKRDSDEHYVDDVGQWMISGDQAKMDSQGQVYIMGRYKDLIIRAGENISPASIESVLDTMPGIVSQVVGVPDEVAGEVPAAVVKLADGAELQQDVMHDLLSEKLGNAFLPAHVLTTDDLGLDDFPRTESGKYQKTELRKPVADFVDKKQNGTQSSDAADLQAELHQIWAGLLGISTKKLLVSSPIQDLADSITVMQATQKIRRQLGVQIEPGEVFENPTVEQQARLLQDRRSIGTSTKPEPEKPRSGPPGVEDIAHALGSHDKASELQRAFSAIAEPLDLSWEQDVEDVVPVWDWGRVMLRGPRAQSWNHRHAFATVNAKPEQLRSCLEQALSHQAMLRTLALQPHSSTPSFAIIRSSPRWYRHVITEVDAVETADDLRRLVLDDPKLDFATAPGPLFRAVIAPIKDTNTAGLVYQSHHSCFDGLSLPNLIEDLQMCLATDNAAPEIPPRTSYKRFADDIFLHRTSAQARVNCDFHVQRLRGLGKLDKALWPFQRASEWFKGNFDDVAQDFPDRKRLDGDKSIGVDGVKGSTPLPGISQLKREHGLSAPAVMKAALALLNSRYTSEKTAVFTNYEAGRSWPFQEEWIASLLPNAMDINGPTLEAVLNKIAIDDSETCVAMMQRLQEEQRVLTKHAHAPLLDLQQQLGEEDGAQLIETMRRQIFNWLPNLKSVMQEEPDQPLQRVQMQSRSDVGLLWNCGMVEDTFHVTASFDDAQLRAAEVEEAVERWLEIARWMTENWDAPVRDCPAL